MDLDTRILKFKSRITTHNLRWLLSCSPEELFISRILNPKVTQIIEQKFNDSLINYSQINN